MGCLADWQLKRDVPLNPSEDAIKRDGKISYGIGSYGIDLRVGYKFDIFSPVNATEIDPKKFDKGSLIRKDLTPVHKWEYKEWERNGQEQSGEQCIYCAAWKDTPSEKGSCNQCPYVLIPPHSFALAETIEYIEIPRDTICIVTNKSTYARCGIVLPCTVLEPCMSSDTEVLTRQGWRLLKDSMIGQEVLTRKIDGIAEYQPIESKQERRFKGELLHFDGRSVNQLVTEDHKIPVVQQVREWGQRVWQQKLMKAESIYGKWNYCFDRRVEWYGESDIERIEIAGKSYLASDFMFFLGCWLGDGSAYKGTDGGYLIKLAVVTKEKKREAFRDALRRLGIDARLRERGFQWYDKNLCQWLRKLGKAKDKYIPREILSYSPRLLRRLLDGLMASDGTLLTNTYTTASKQLADDVQEVIYKCGLAAIVRKIESQFQNEGEMFTAYKIRITSDTMTPLMNPSNHSKLTYDGWVYDITVPNHIFLCRRNGMVSWTGNCWEGIVTLEIGNTTPLPARVYCNEGICQCLFFRTDGYTEAIAKCVTEILSNRCLDRPEMDAQFQKLMEDGRCKISYADKAGRYQGQKGITLPSADKSS